jgi:hypothetical protein
VKYKVGFLMPGQREYKEVETEVEQFREFCEEFIAFNNGKHDVLVVPKTAIGFIELIEEVNDASNEDRS